MTDSAAFWNRIAKRYAAQPVENPEAFERKIEITLDLLAPGHRVLEIGCGTGSLGLRLAPAVASYHGLDISEEMIRFAEDKTRGAGVENLHFEVGPFDEDFDSFGVASLDGVCAFSILHLLPDRREALGRIHELLKPGGFFVSSTVCLGGGGRFFFAPVLGIMRALRLAPSVSLFSKDELMKDMSIAGFEGIEAPGVGAKDTVAFLVARKPG